MAASHGPLTANFCLQLQRGQQKNIRQIPVQGHSTKTSAPENRQGHQKQGMSENLSQLGGASGAVTTKCNTLY